MPKRRSSKFAHRAEKFQHSLSTIQSVLTVSSKRFPDPDYTWSSGSSAGDPFHLDKGVMSLSLPAVQRKPVPLCVEHLTMEITSNRAVTLHRATPSVVTIYPRLPSNLNKPLPILPKYKKLPQPKLTRPKFIEHLEISADMVRQSIYSQHGTNVSLQRSNAIRSRPMRGTEPPPPPTRIPPSSPSPTTVKVLRRLSLLQQPSPLPLATTHAAKILSTAPPTQETWTAFMAATNSLQAGEVCQQRRRRTSTTALTRPKPPRLCPAAGKKPGKSSRSSSGNTSRRASWTLQPNVTQLRITLSPKLSHSCGGHGSRCEAPHNTFPMAEGEVECFHSHFSDDSDDDDK